MGENKDKDHECDCGDNCDCHDEHETVKLTLDDNSELECEIIGTFDLDGKEYIALLPLDEEDVLIYNFSDNDGEVELSLIESDEEFDAVSKAFYEIFENEEGLEEE